MNNPTLETAVAPTRACGEATLPHAGAPIARDDRIIGSSRLTSTVNCFVLWSRIGVQLDGARYAAETAALIVLFDDFELNTEPLELRHTGRLRHVDRRDMALLAV